MSAPSFDPTDGKRIERGPGLGGDYLAPATADPATEGLVPGAPGTSYRREGPTVHLFPTPVEVTREQLGVRASPVRAYLERHRDQAAADRTIAEHRLEDARRDLAEVIDRQVSIETALGHLDFLETENGRLGRMIVGPVRPDPTTTQEKTQ